MEFVGYSFRNIPLFNPTLLTVYRKHSIPISSMSDSIYIPDPAREAQQLYRPALDHQAADLTVREQLEAFAELLFTAHQNGDEAVCFEINNWHPAHIGQAPESILKASFSREDAHLTVARAHGFEDWAEVELKGDQPFDPEFELAIDTLLVGDLDQLKTLVEQHPALLHERSPYGHAATLFHYIGSNGVETRRQQVPLNLPEITRFLLEAGADRNATARLYGGQFDTLSLLTSSAHPYEAGIAEEMEAILQEG